MFGYALAQASMFKKFEQYENSGLLDKLKKCKGNWDGHPDKLFIERNQVGVGDHLLPRSNSRPGSVSALFGVKSINDKPLDTRVVLGTVGQINLGYKCTDV